MAVESIVPPRSDDRLIRTAPERSTNTRGWKMPHGTCCSRAATYRDQVILLFALACTLCVPSARAQTTESFQTWTASSPDTWEGQNLSGASQDEPVNAVVEVAVRNAKTVIRRCGDARAVGTNSTMSRLKRDPAQNPREPAYLGRNKA